MPASPTYASGLKTVGKLSNVASIIRVGVVIVIIPFSLSLTRYLSAQVLRLPTKLTAVGFAVLLSAHLALLIWWMPIVDASTDLIAIFGMLIGILATSSQLPAQIT